MRPAVAPAAVQDRCFPALPIEASPSAFQEIGRRKAMALARDILVASQERMAWEDSRSAIVLLSLALKYPAFAAFLFLVGRSMLDWLGTIVRGAAGLLHLATYWGWLRSTVYRMSGQGLEVTSGPWNRRTGTYEIHRLGEAVISSTLLLRITSRADPVIQNPPIRLQAIRRADRVRDLLLEAGQIEAGRMDILRWR